MLGRFGHTVVRAASGRCAWPLQDDTVAPDPIFELVERCRYAREGYCAETLPDEETDAYDENVLTPAEDELMATKPTIQEGIAAVLDFALEAMEREADFFLKPLIQNARDAARGGVGVAGQAGDGPLVALWAKWLSLRDAEIPGEIKGKDRVLSVTTLRGDGDATPYG